MSRLRGDFFENLAVEYLKDKGYKILARNWRRRFGEIDIVAQKKKRLYFVEVKARKHPAYYGPYEAVTYRKWEKIKKAALAYLGQRENADFNYAVVSLLYGKDWTEFMLLEGNPYAD